MKIDTIPSRLIVGEIKTTPPVPLDPGIREVVALLNAHGFKTTDSGDGRSKVDTMECALDIPNVIVIVEHPEKGIREARRLHGLMKANGITIRGMGEDSAPTIQQSYDPGNNVAILALYGVDDALLSASQARRVLARQAYHEERTCERTGHAPIGSGQCRCGWRGDEER